MKTNKHIPRCPHSQAQLEVLWCMGQDSTVDAPHDGLLMLSGVSERITVETTEEPVYDEIIQRMTPHQLRVVVDYPDYLGGTPVHRTISHIAIL